jgi:hypothetical protein
MLVPSTPRLVVSKMLSVQQTVVGRARSSALKCNLLNRFQFGHSFAIDCAGSSGRLENMTEPKKGAAMFGITSETIHQFSLAEILLLIAMNLETSRLASENHARLATGTVLGS